MAIEIIKRNTRPDDKVWKGDCRNCGSEAKCIRSDLTHYTYDQRHGAYSWEVCPVCEAGKDKNGYGGICFFEEKTYAKQA